MKKVLLISTLLFCLPFPVKASTTVIDGATTYAVADDMGPPGGATLIIPAGGAYGIWWGTPMLFISFDWPDATEVVSFNNNPGNTMMYQITGIQPDRYVTFDFRNAGGAYGIYFGWASDAHDTQVLNFSAGVPEPSTWALMLVGFAGIFVAFRRKTNDRWA